MKNLKLFSKCLVGLAFAGSMHAQTSLIKSGDTWKYLDDGSNQGTTWRETSFDDASWVSGPSPLGYGDSDEATVVSYGTSSSSKFPTTYFRKEFNITNASLFLEYELRVKRDDGIVVYVNGTEVYRDNMPSGTPSYSTYAAGVAGDDGASWLSTTLDKSYFVDGSNLIAAEIHQQSASSSDISFDIELTGNTTISSTVKDIRWGSSGDPLSGLAVTWTNKGSKDSIVWGYTGSFEQGVFLGTQRMGNASGENFFKYVFSTALENSTINYKIYDSNAGVWGDPKTFQTAPPSTDTTFCFLGVGDSRSGMSVWNQISTLADSKNANFTLFNGDIVNDGGSNTDWSSWFSNGKQYIENNLIYHSMGNHDESSSGFYENTFELPKANSTNLYYSFTYGNAVFICLNSESPSSTTQYNWLKSTLETYKDKTWKIVFFHRPFYTIGNHAGEMDSYYNTWWKTFDDYGVDLILNGHDHMYERAKPINRKVSTTTYVDAYGSEEGEGRCQVVCGGAGAPLYSASTSWFIEEYKSTYNFCSFCVSGSSLSCEVYDQNNSIIDTFSIIKAYKGETGIGSPNQKFNPIEVFPNPVNDNFRIKYNSPQKGEGVMRIIDELGKVLKEEKVSKLGDAFEKSLTVSRFAAGVYFVEINIGKQTDSAMIVIK